MKDAILIAIRKIEERGIGVRKVNYRMRDAAFSRQRYWGEPFPMIWQNGVATPLSEKDLPLELPHIDKYGPGPEGEGPLANIPAWTARHLETNTMPGYAGSSWYFLRYMDPENDGGFLQPRRVGLLGPGRSLYRRLRTCRRPPAVQPHVDKIPV